MENVSKFIDHLVSNLIIDFHTAQTDNYDASRFSADGVDRSGEFDIVLSKMTIVDLIRNAEKYFAAYQQIVDPTSRQLFIDLLRYRMAGHMHVRLPTNTPDFFQHILPPPGTVRTESRLPIAGSFGEMGHFSVPVGDRAVELDCWDGNVGYAFNLRQYFYDRDGVRICPEPGDHVIDAGSCLGECSIAFAAAVGETGHVHAFDVCDVHVLATRHNAAQNPGLPVTVHEYGLGKADIDAPLLQLGNFIHPGMSVTDMPTPPIRRLDTLVEQGLVERVDFIKMDVEGSEIDALAGAVESIRRFRPKLAISLYHKKSDFRDIPLFIQSILPDYRFHLDHYTIHHEETVLFGVAR
jgi:FkbM family methyltransferase